MTRGSVQAESLVKSTENDISLRAAMSSIDNEANVRLISPDSCVVAGSSVVADSSSESYPAGNLPWLAWRSIHLQQSQWGGQSYSTGFRKACVTRKL